MKLVLSVANCLPNNRWKFRSKPPLSCFEDVEVFVVGFFYCRTLYALDVHGKETCWWLRCCLSRLDPWRVSDTKLISTDVVSSSHSPEIFPSVCSCHLCCFITLCLSGWFIPCTVPTTYLAHQLARLCVQRRGSESFWPVRHLIHRPQTKTGSVWSRRQTSKWCTGKPDPSNLY